MLRFKVAGRERKFSIGNAKIGKLDSAREVAKQHLWSVSDREGPAGAGAALQGPQVHDGDRPVSFLQINIISKCPGRRVWFQYSHSP